MIFDDYKVISTCFYVKDEERYKKFKDLAWANNLHFFDKEDDNGRMIHAFEFSGFFTGIDNKFLTNDELNTFVEEHGDDDGDSLFLFSLSKVIADDSFCVLVRVYGEEDDSEKKAEVDSVIKPNHFDIVELFDNSKEFLKNNGLTLNDLVFPYANVANQ